MKKTIAFILMIALIAALALTGCGKKPLFNVTTDEDNTIRITAEKPHHVPNIFPIHAKYQVIFFIHFFFLFLLLFRFFQKRFYI